MKTGVGGGDGEGVRDFCFSMWHGGGMVGVNERMSSPPPPTTTWLKKGVWGHGWWLRE